MDLKILSTVFTSVFIAELGDKTQLATLLFASDKDTSKLTVFVGASLALVRNFRYRRDCRRFHLPICQRKGSALLGGHRLYRHRHLDTSESLGRNVHEQIFNEQTHPPVNMNEDAEKEYKAKPREFVEKWEKIAETETGARRARSAGDQRLRQAVRARRPPVHALELHRSRMGTGKTARRT